VIAVAAITSGSVAAATNAADGRRLALDGDWKFKAGDDPAWAHPEFDDSAWQPIPVPGSWRRNGIPASVLLGWYRKEFSAPEWLRSADAAIQLGVLYRADEVYLNGVKIGSEGLLGSSSPDATLPPVMHRVYRLPADLVRFDSTNVLTIRLGRAICDGGVFGDGVSITDYASARLAAENYRLRLWAIEACLLAVDLLVSFGCIALLIAGLRERAFVLFCLLWIPMSWVGIAEGRALYALLGASTFTKFLAAVALGNSVLIVPNFFAEILGKKIPRYVRACQLVILTNNLSYALSFFGWWPAGWMVPIILLWIVCFATMSLTSMAWATRGILLRQSGALPLLLGLAGFWICFAAELVTPLADFTLETGIAGAQLGIRVFLLCCLCVALDRYRQIYQQNRALSGRILDAQEAERARIARDLHDSVGQSLSSIKLAAEMLGSVAVGKLAEPLQQLRSDTTEMIREVRRVSSDLRPGALEYTGLPDAVAELCCVTTERFGLTAQLHVLPNLPELEVRTVSHLYRICQEAIRNAVEHARAGRIEVRLELAGKKLTMSIEDDGQGIQEETQGTGRRGIGLRSIRERAELLGGTASVSSQPGAGTRVEVIVPITKMSPAEKQVE